MDVTNSAKGGNFTKPEVELYWEGPCFLSGLSQLFFSHAVDHFPKKINGGLIVLVHHG